jgi:hypothetical protein
MRVLAKAPASPAKKKKSERSGLSGLFKVARKQTVFGGTKHEKDTLFWHTDCLIGGDRVFYQMRFQSSGKRRSAISIAQ